MTTATPPLARIALTGIMAATLAGCAVGPDYAPPAPPAAPALSKGAFLRAEGQDAATPLAHWWEEMGDPVLNHLVEAGLREAPAIAAARARLRAARAGLASARLEQLPTAGTGAMYVHTHLPAASLGGALGGSDLTALGFDAQWEVDLWGAKRRAVEQARAAAEAQAARLADTQVSLSAEIVRAYVSLRAGEQALALRRDIRATDELAADLVRQRRAAGTVGQQALESAEAQLAGSRAEEARAAAEVTVWRDTLALLTGQAPGTLDTLPAGAIPLPPAHMAIGDPGAMLARRPDIRAADRAYANATAGVGVAKARRYPTISLMGLGGAGGSSVSNLASSAQLATILMPRLEWAFPDFARVEAGVRGAKAQRAAALADYQGAVLGALNDAEGALARFGAARLAEAQAAAAATHGDTLAGLETRRADAGVSSRGEALAAHRQALQARLAAIDARAGLSLAYAALAKALGLGWQG